MKNPAECRNRRSRWTLQEMRYVENHYATADRGRHWRQPRPARFICGMLSLQVSRHQKEGRALD
ncbi:hypothetical protein [Lonsdalea quercina]|uniref:hypothetical protein n=1 Tax=Lonsdalea quercina TaxID=71657 RepID=UPI0039759CCD